MAYRRHQRRIGGHRPAHGALVRGTFSSEFYVAVRALPGLPAGLWHYRPQGHGLARIGPQAAPDAALLPAEALAAVIATAVWRRTGHKYGDRCLRYVLADLGHALENLCQVAAALGAGTTLSGAFDESVLARLLQVDEREEGVLAQVLLHAGPVQLRQLPPALLPAPITDDLGIGITGTLHQAASLRGAPQRAAHIVAAAQVEGDPLPLIAADPAGAARGYRHAFIEAGLVGERLYLSGQALGLGVCGIGAFFDDETAALAGVDPAQEWVVHLVAVGATG